MSLLSLTEGSRLWAGQAPIRCPSRWRANPSGAGPRGATTSPGPLDGATESTVRTAKERVAVRSVDEAHHAASESGRKSVADSNNRTLRGRSRGERR